MKFCSNCSNLLEPLTHTRVLSFYCTQCKVEYPSTPEDTLMVSTHKADEAQIYSELIFGAARDRTIKKVERTCPKCKNEFMSLVRVGVDEKVIYTCKCGYIE